MFVVVDFFIEVRSDLCQEVLKLFNLVVIRGTSKHLAARRVLHLLVSIVDELP